MEGVKTFSSSEPVASTCKIVAAILFLIMRRLRNPEAAAAKTWLSLKVGATQMWHDQMFKANHNRCKSKVTAFKSTFLLLNMFPPDLT
jgi:amino acid permease